MTCSMNRSKATEASGRVEGEEVRIERDELLLSYQASSVTEIRMGNSSTGPSGPLCGLQLLL